MEHVNKLARSFVTNSPSFRNRDDYIAQLWEATKQETFERSAAFLGVPERIGEFTVPALTLYHWNSLTLFNSVFIPPFEPPDALQIARFFCILETSPYSPVISEKRRSEITKACRQFVLPSKPWFKTERAIRKFEEKNYNVLERTAKLIGHKDTPELGTIRRYVLDAMVDRLGGSRTNVNAPDYYSDSAAICAALMREYGFTEADVLNMPMKKIWQYLKERKWYNSENPCLLNPSSRLTSLWLDQCNAEARKN